MRHDKTKTIIGLLTVVIGFLAAVPVQAISADAIKQLERVYDSRADLKKYFRPDDWMPYGLPQTRGLADLEAWARQYGWKEHPQELSSFAPPAPVAEAEGIVATPPITNLPKLKGQTSFNFSTLTADAVLVLDDATGDVLLARNSRRIWPLASITKLMTAMVALDLKPNKDGATTLTKSDDIGGARLSAIGRHLTLQQLLYTTLIASTNNTAHAIPRACDQAQDEFIAAMNRKAAIMKLDSMHFTDPSGIEPTNVGSALDIATMARRAFSDYRDIRTAASTAKYDIRLGDGYYHQVKNTNVLLTDPNNGLYVYGGKTGYLDESLWNLAVKMRDVSHPKLVVVMLGSDNKTALFRDAEKAARWVWANYRWP